jgi:hypothetical protein
LSLTVNDITVIAGTHGHQFDILALEHSGLAALGSPLSAPVIHCDWSLKLHERAALGVSGEKILRLIG